MRLWGIITLAWAAGLCACDVALDLSSFRANEGAGGQAGGLDPFGMGGAGGSDAPCSQAQPPDAETWLCTDSPRLLSGHGDTLFWLGKLVGTPLLRKARLGEDSVTELGAQEQACGLVARADVVFVRTNAGEMLALSAEDGAPLQAQGGYGQNCALAANDTHVAWFDALGGQLLQADTTLNAITVVLADVAEVRSIALSASGVMWVGRLTERDALTFYFSKPGETLALPTDDEPCAVAFDGSDALITTLNGLLRWDPQQPQSPFVSILSDSVDALCRLDANGSHVVAAARNTARLHIVPLAGQPQPAQLLNTGGVALSDVALVGDSVVWAPRKEGVLVRYPLP